MTKAELAKLLKRAAIYAMTHHRVNPGNLGKPQASQDAHDLKRLARKLENGAS